MRRDRTESKRASRTHRADWPFQIWSPDGGQTLLRQAACEDTTAVAFVIGAS